MAAHNERRHPAKRARSCATRNPRLRGCSPLRTPKMWSENAKAKKCRSAAFFLTPLRPLPIDPSGAKRNFMRVELKAPLCKGGSADRRWGIVTLPIHRTTLTRSQSLRPCGAPAYASGPSVAARHLPTLWGVTLYTREALRGDASIAPYTPFAVGSVGRGLDPSKGPCHNYNSP